jgi:small neutral amino acid transporter SnatA (MarC family)
VFVDLQATLLFTTSLLAIVNPLSSAVLFVTMAPRFSAGVQATTYTQWQDLLVITAVPIGLNIVTRVMGILVTATAFGLLARGIGGLLPGLMLQR